MKASGTFPSARVALVVLAGLGVAAIAHATRVGGAAPPAASAVQASAQQPASAQVDESASLRQGAVTALDVSGNRIQVQGVWIDVAADKTTLLRDGRAAALDTLKVGEPIRFTVAPATAAVARPTARVIYAP